MGWHMADEGVVTRRRASTSAALAVGLITGLIAIVGNAVAARFTDWTGTWSWLAVPTLGVLFSAVSAVASSRIQTYFPDGSAVEIVHGQARPLDLRRRRGTRLPVVLLVTCLVLGGGGYAVSQAARYAVGWVTGGEAGTQVLSANRSTISRGVTLRVDSIEETAHFTRVTAVVTNGLDNQITLTLFSNCTLRAEDGTTLEADAFRSDWTESIGPGNTHRGIVTFIGHLPHLAAKATLSFARVGEMGFSGPKTLTVKALVLRRPS